MHVLGSTALDSINAINQGSLLQLLQTITPNKIIRPNHPWLLFPNTFWTFLLAVRSTYLHLCFSIAFGENLFETCLEDAHVVVDDGFFFGGVVLSHDAYQREVSGRTVSRFKRGIMVSWRPTC